MSDICQDCGAPRATPEQWADESMESGPIGDSLCWAPAGSHVQVNIVSLRSQLSQATAMVAAMREALEKLAVNAAWHRKRHSPTMGEPNTGALAAAEAALSSSLEVSREHDERVRREALEEAERKLEAERRAPKAKERRWRPERGVTVQVRDASYKGRKVLLDVLVDRGGHWPECNSAYLTRKAAREIGRELIAASKRPGRLTWPVDE